MSILDQKLASKIARATGWKCEATWLVTEGLEEDARYVTVVEMKALGLVNAMSSLKCTAINHEFSLFFPGTVVKVRLKDEPQHKFLVDGKEGSLDPDGPNEAFVGAAYLTEPGQELLSINPEEPDPEAIEMIARSLRQRRRIADVQVQADPTH